MSPFLDDIVEPTTAALGFALLDTRGKPAPPEQTMIKAWLDNWPRRADEEVRVGRAAPGARRAR